MQPSPGGGAPHASCPIDGIAASTGGESAGINLSTQGDTQQQIHLPILTQQIAANDYQCKPAPKISPSLLSTPCSARAQVHCSQKSQYQNDLKMIVRRVSSRSQKTLSRVTDAGPTWRWYIKLLRPAWQRYCSLTYFHIFLMASLCKNGDIQSRIAIATSWIALGFVALLGIAVRNLIQL